MVLFCNCHCVELVFALKGRHDNRCEGISAFQSCLYQDKSCTLLSLVKWTASSRTNCVTCSQQHSFGLLLCVCVVVCVCVCVHVRARATQIQSSPLPQMFTALTSARTSNSSRTLPPACSTVHTFFVVMANDGVLYDIGGAEADAVLFAMGGRGSNLDSTLLALKVLLPLVVRPYLVAAHPPDQALALANGERLQKTLVYLHVLTKDIT